MLKHNIFLLYNISDGCFTFVSPPTRKQPQIVPMSGTKKGNNTKNGSFSG